jgi:hypothetical protein
MCINARIQISFLRLNPYTLLTSRDIVLHIKFAYGIFGQHFPV